MTSNLKRHLTAAPTSMIYARIKADKASGGVLWKYLRRSNKKYRRKYGTAQNKESGIKNRVSIEERAEIVDYRERAGDPEGDTMIGSLKSSQLPN